jgi:hypothetical protein
MRAVVWIGGGVLALALATGGAYGYAWWRVRDACGRVLERGGMVVRMLVDVDDVCACAARDAVAGGGNPLAVADAAERLEQLSRGSDLLGLLKDATDPAKEQELGALVQVAEAHRQCLPPPLGRGAGR